MWKCIQNVNLYMYEHVTVALCEQTIKQRKKVTVNKNKEHKV